MDLLILVGLNFCFEKVVIWMVVEAGVAEPVAAIQDENAGDPDIGLSDKRQIPDLNAQGTKEGTRLDKIARVARLWAGEFAVNRSSVTSTLALNKSAHPGKSEAKPKLPS